MAYNIYEIFLKYVYYFVNIQMSDKSEYEKSYDKNISIVDNKYLLKIFFPIFMKCIYGNIF